jgi:pimeloyl-ACP methyl ester carboxylesterase
MGSSLRNAFRVPALALVIVSTTATIARAQDPPTLDWRHCGQAPRTQCTSMRVPLAYDAPHGKRISVSIARLPATDRAHRRGALLVNFGGPGDVAADVIKSFTDDSLPALNDRFDIVAMDPRGVGRSRPAIACGGGGSGVASAMRPPDMVDFPGLLAKDRGYIERCVAANPGMLAHVSTANVARDMDLLRRALGERRIGYFGQSYGTLLGATYARLFPRHFSAMVLDGPLDPDEWLNHPLHEEVDGAAAQEDALRQFLASCPACGFGGPDPAGAFDALIASLARHPVPAHGRDRRPVGRAAALAAVEQSIGGGGVHTRAWPRLAQALSDAAHGDGTRLRELADGGMGTDPSGNRLPEIDRFIAINASEQRYPRRTAPYIQAARRAWAQSPHFGDSYRELVYSLWPIHDRDAYRGPFTLPRGTPVPLVVAATHDPVTPIANAAGLIQEMGRGRLLTVDGNGHTMYPGNSACVDAAVEAYFRHGTLPPRQKRCAQD